jgi:putative ABC transport system substrate-binding protein
VIDRRTFLGGLALGIAAAPFAARAQQPAIPVIGALMTTAADDPESKARIAAFLQGLRELGWTDGRNVRIDVRWAAGDPERARTYAAELVRLKPNVILANTALALLPLKRETGTIPIVFTLIYDPVGSGFVASLAQPGGNITGFTLGEFSLGGKMIQVLQEVAPQVSRVAVILNPNQPPHVAIWRAIEAAAPSLKVHLTAGHVKDSAEIEPVIKAFAGAANGGLVVLPSPITEAHREQVIALAARHRLPAVYGFRSFIKSGGLVSYGINTVDPFRRAALYVDRILKGAKPGDLPVQQPTKYELVINLKTATVLGLTIPPSLLLRTDEVIE